MKRVALQKPVIVEVPLCCLVEYYGDDPTVFTHGNYPVTITQQGNKYVVDDSGRLLTPDELHDYTPQSASELSDLLDYCAGGGREKELGEEATHLDMDPEEYKQFYGKQKKGKTMRRRNNPMRRRSSTMRRRNRREDFHRNHPTSRLRRRRAQSSKAMMMSKSIRDLADELNRISQLIARDSDALDKFTGTTLDEITPIIKDLEDDIYSIKVELSMFRNM